MASTGLVFLSFRSVSDIYWMVPLMGFCQLALFGGYAIYFPELFPNRLRATGAGMCFNGGRILAAPMMFVSIVVQATRSVEMACPIPARRCRRSGSCSARDA